MAMGLTRVPLNFTEDRVVRNASFAIAVGVLLMATFALAQAGEVAIYTGTTQWISKTAADEQAQICADKLTALGIKKTWFPNDTDMDALAEWMTSVTDNGQVDVLVLYGDLPPTIYPEGNAQPDGSIAELFIQSTDGDAIINHADYMFWGLNGRNKDGGLQNMTDIPGIVMWDDDTCVAVTDEGKHIPPSPTDVGSAPPLP